MPYLFLFLAVYSSWMRAAPFGELHLETSDDENHLCGASLHKSSGVARGGPSRARPDQLCSCNAYYLTVDHVRIGQK